MTSSPRIAADGVVEQSAGVLVTEFAVSYRLGLHGERRSYPKQKSMTAELPGRFLFGVPSLSSRILKRMTRSHG